MRAVDLTAAFGGPGEGCDERENKSDESPDTLLFSRSS